MRDIGGVSMGMKKLSEVIERVKGRRGVDGAVSGDGSLALGIVSVSEGGRGGRGADGGGGAGIVGLRAWRRGL